MALARAGAATIGSSPSAPAPTGVGGTGAPAGAGAGAGAGGPSGGFGGAGRGASTLTVLNKKMVDLLERQKRVAEEFHALLTDPSDGLIENTRLTCKNLDAAVVQSRQPGYFHYHKPSTRVKQVESGNVLQAKKKEIMDIEAQIESLKEDIAAERSKPIDTGTGSVPITSLDQWFSVYKRPNPSYGGDGFTTTFVPSTKVYGGSSHYEAFKSVSKTMKVGRMTR